MVRIITTSVTNDDDWQILGEIIKSTRDVEIDGYLHLNFDSDASNTFNDSDLFLIKRSGETQLRVDRDGVLSLKEFIDLPTTSTEGGIIYSGNNFYLGIG